MHVLSWLSLSLAPPLTLSPLLPLLPPPPPSHHPHVCCHSHVPSPTPHHLACTVSLSLSLTLPVAATTNPPTWPIPMLSLHVNDLSSPGALSSSPALGWFTGTVNTVGFATWV